LKAFDEDLERITVLVAQLGGLAEASIRDAAEALLVGNPESAARIFAGDAKIDELSEEIETLCARIIALRAPLADDLRGVLGAFKIAVLIDRIGDCARSIAEHAPAANDFAGEAQLQILRGMVRAVSELMRRALDAFITQDWAACEAIWTADQLIDDSHSRLVGELMHLMEQNPRKVGPGTAVLMASLKFERIGDHAVNIARVVYHTATGARLTRGEGQVDIASAFAHV
jgi:phosphate transport system protein